MNKATSATMPAMRSQRSFRVMPGAVFSTKINNMIATNEMIRKEKRSQLIFLMVYLLFDYSFFVVMTSLAKDNISGLDFIAFTQPEGGGYVAGHAPGAARAERDLGDHGAVGHATALELLAEEALEEGA